MKTISLTERELDAVQCKRGIIIFSEDFVTLKNDQYKNCMALGKKCEQMVEVLDQLLITADKAFAEVYGVKK